MRISPLKARLLALLIDYLIILAYMALLAAVSAVLFVVVLDGYPDYLGSLGVVGTQLLFFCLLTLPVGLYLFLAESGRRGATIGKQKLGLRVVHVNGRRATKGQVALRTVIKLLPWELAHTFVWQLQYVFYKDGYEAAVPAWVLAGLNAALVLGLVYMALVVWRQDRRSVHDLAAGTKVIAV